MFNEITSSYGGLLAITCKFYNLWRLIMNYKIFQQTMKIFFYFAILSYLASQPSLAQKKAGDYTIQEWHAKIDTAWGAGRSTAEKLQIFDIFWNSVDQKFGAFHNLDIDWQALKDHYRPIIENGISKGRFAGIMTHLSFALKELHTKVFNMEVFDTPLKPGLPLMVLYSQGDLFNQGHFGAGLTPLSDSSLVVYRVIENHPLNLKPGDIVLGYDGIAWKDLYKTLIQAELPVTSNPAIDNFPPGYPGSSDKSYNHLWLRSAGLNWHLFDTIDVKKYDTNEIQHLSVLSLDTLTKTFNCSEQIAPSGIPHPDLSNDEWITWGVIDNTEIGYINLWTWYHPSIESKFTEAVNYLVLDRQVKGLIFDYRNNTGGFPHGAHTAYGLLFNETFDKLKLYVRDDPNDHFGLTYFPVNFESFPVTSFLFDHPIAILTGPTAGSSGDINALRLKYHPMARVFGKPTNCGFSRFFNVAFSFSEWVGACTDGNFYLEDNPGGFLSHVGFKVDEPIWLEPDDVAKGEDTVVKRALAWITNLTHAHNVTIDKLFAQPASDSVFISAEVENPNQHQIQVTAMINNPGSMTVDSVDLYDDGLDQDSLAGDNVWGAKWAVPYDETYFTVDITTNDPIDSTERILPKILRFTTVGPVELYATNPPYRDISYNQSRRRQTIGFIFYNAGSQATAKNVKAEISTDDQRVYAIMLNTSTLGDIAAGAADTSGLYTFVYAEDYGPESTINNPINFDISIYSNDILYWTTKIDYVTGLEKSADNSLPLNYSLSQNYPNPFNPITNIEYRIPNSQFITLKIYNLLGQKVATLVSAKQPGGSYKVEWDASEFASGVYLYRLATDKGFVQTKKLIVLK